MTRQGTARSAERSWKLMSIQVHHPEGHVVNLQKSHINPSHSTYHFYVSFPEGIELHIPGFALGLRPEPWLKMIRGQCREVTRQHLGCGPPKVKFGIVRTN